MCADHMRKSIKKLTNYEMLLASISRAKARKTKLYFGKEKRNFEQTRSFFNSVLTVFYCCVPDISKLYYT